MSRRIDNQDELIAHYKARMKSMLPFMRHLNDCQFTMWQVSEYFQKSLGPTYSAGPMPPCTCGAAALMAIVKAEVGDET